MVAIIIIDSALNHQYNFFKKKRASMSIFSSLLLLCSVATTNVSPMSSPNLSVDSNKNFECAYAPSGEGPDAYGDIYETNNNIDTATRLIPDNFIYTIHIKFK